MQTKLNTAPKIPHVKAGVFFSKQKRMLELEEEDKEMEVIIEQLLSQHNANAQIFKEIERKITAFQSEKNLAQLQQIVAEKQIASLQLQLETQKVKMQEEEELLNIEKEIEQLQKQLSREQSLQTEGRRLIARYRGELQLQKAMMSSQRSVKAACKQLSNTYTNCLKNYNILEKKLESKEKYLSILKKKEERIVNKEKSEKKAVPTKGVATVNSSVQAKTYSQLIREKNAIMLAKK